MSSLNIRIFPQEFYEQYRAQQQWSLDSLLNLKVWLGWPGRDDWLQG